MGLKSGYPFWAIKNGLMQSYSPLEADLRCEVAEIGAGITGAIIADALADAGCKRPLATPRPHCLDSVCVRGLGALCFNERRPPPRQVIDLKRIILFPASSVGKRIILFKSIASRKSVATADPGQGAAL